jgi:DNA-binding beta-propeller fold protein YncE
VFVAHTAFDSIDVIDGETLAAVGRIEGCPEGSGVICAADARLVFAAARGAGKVLVIDPDRLVVRQEMAVGPRPNGLAWDGSRKQLLVADIEPTDHSARLIDVARGTVVASTPLPGRPRWCAYEPKSDRYLINISEPALVVVLSAGTGVIAASWPISAQGPHGLDIDHEGGRIFVACDGGQLVAVDSSGIETGRTEISAAPDAIWFNSQLQRLYVGVGRPGVIDVIDSARMIVVQSIATEIGAHTTGLRPHAPTSLCIHARPVRGGCIRGTLVALGNDGMLPVPELQ